MHLKILTAAYLRPEVLEVFLESYVENKKYIASRAQLSLAVVGSKKDDKGKNKKLVEKYPDTLWVEYKNFPISDKFQHLVSSIQDLPFDAVITTGSDDIMHNKALGDVLDALYEGYDQVGFKDIYMLDSIGEKAIFWEGYMSNRINESIGAYRVLSRKILAMTDYTLWALGRDNGLDGSMTHILSKHKINEKVISCKYAPIVDIKSPTNIWPFSKFDGVQAKYPALLSVFPPNVSALIKNIKTKNIAFEV